MGYVLLFLEDLAVALLLVATLTACIARLRRRWVQLTLWVLVVLTPLAMYAGLTGLMGYLSFHVLAAPAKWFYALLALIISYTVGVVWLWFRGLRRVDGEPPATAAAGWPRGKLAVALAVTLALQMMTFWNLDSAVQNRLATLRTEAGALALSVAPARVPDRDNAALVYARAFEAMGPMEAWEEKWDEWLKPGASGFDPQDAKLRKLLGEQAPAVALLREAAAKPDCYFDRDYGRPSIDMLLPELGHLRTAARLLALEARCRAADGDIGAALEDVNSLFAMAEHSASDPILIGMLVAVAIDSQAVSTLQAVLASGQASSNDLARCNVDESVCYRRILERAFRMEEAFGVSIVCRMSDEWDFWLIKTGESGGGVRGLALLYRVFLLGDDLAAYRSFMKELRRLAVQPYYRVRDDWEGFEKRLYCESRGLLTHSLAPAAARCAEVATQADARRRSARLALAMYRYRARDDRFPDKLEDLAPEFIAFVPRDPFDGKPMKLKLTDRGLVVYSIGPDMTDDGGMPFDEEERTGDITFELSNSP